MKPRTENSTGVSHTGGRDASTGAIFHCIPRWLAGRWSRRVAATHIGRCKMQVFHEAASPSVSQSLPLYNFVNNDERSSYFLPQKYSILLLKYLPVFRHFKAILNTHIEKYVCVLGSCFSLTRPRDRDKQRRFSFCCSYFRVFNENKIPEVSKSFISSQIRKKERGCILLETAKLFNPSETALSTFHPMQWWPLSLNSCMVKVMSDSKWENCFCTTWPSSKHTRIVHCVPKDHAFSLGSTSAYWQCSTRDTTKMAQAARLLPRG